VTEIPRLEQSKAGRSELMDALATRASVESLASLQAAVAELSSLSRALQDGKVSEEQVNELHAQISAVKADLGTLVTEIPRLEQLKAGRSELDRIRDEVRTTLYRGIDDVNRTFRMLLDSKAGADAVAEVGAAFEIRVRALQQEMEQLAQAVDARKDDTRAIDAARGELHAALRTAFDGLTASLSALASNKVDRATVTALMAENSQAVLDQLRDEVREFRSTIDGSSAR
jgi:uncharacterized phage infection (PIP) family protein YhgE